MGKTIESVTFDPSYYPAAVVSCAVFLYLYKYAGPNISSKLSPKYSSLTEADRIDWNTRFNSSLHSTFVSCMCVYSLIYDEDISNEPIWANSPMVRTSCAIVVGYMTCDVLIMTIHYKKIGEVFYFFHHGASIYAYFYVMTYGVLPYFANFRLMAEFSTPFVNQRWFLDKLKYPRTSTVFMLNGLAMTITFFFVRIAVMPTYWRRVYSVIGTEPFKRLGHISLVLVITCFILDSINIFWFYKMCHGVRKVLTIYSNKTPVPVLNHVDKEE
ncbi:TLC domain-containing protein 4-B [Patella vulgata]|uniref:TLC domain-containing protein n=1 Tax=Patella caerulea TaxID=87958 RepID=A0AAN8JPN3_PATCE|nr:TLC domain-containing protein 4-B [Patella vulgata]XP_050401543.1 TLC domain-containing protein 4-B [Patella vulgata]XP_050401544.1 TLC domain-containing protein 4-B [Patella vulgata]XP_055956195.1 TLC domain-containing protein 4-B [Patella vulgata]